MIDLFNEDCILLHGDCLELMNDIPQGSVDMILTDPPYGTVKGLNINGWGGSKTDWDVEIDQAEMLSRCNRVLRTGGALALFCQDPYTAKLVTETHGNLPFSYRYTWVKDHFANGLAAKKAPVSYTEDICLFFKKYDTMAQHPLRTYAQKILLDLNFGPKDIATILGHRKAEHFFYIESTQFGLCTEEIYNELINKLKINEFDGFLPYAEMIGIDRSFSPSRKFNLPKGKKHKSNILRYKKDYTGAHPTQKPIALMEDLVKTYTDKGDTVLDFTMGSGTTGIACGRLDRKFIGIEIDKDYFEAARDRVDKCTRQGSFDF